MHPRTLIAVCLSALTPLAAPAVDGPVAIVPGSLEVTVAVEANITSFVATVQGGRLAIVADPVNQTIDSAVYTFDWSEIRTGDAKRDRTMLDWAQAKEHPTGTFTLKSFESHDGARIAKGSLEFHGVSRDIEFPVEIVPSGTGFKVSGHGTIDYRDWGLKQFRKFLVFVVKPTVTVNFSFEVTPST